MVASALAAANAAGMHQNPGEIARFAEWLVSRGPVKHALEIGTLKGGTATLWHGLCSGAVISVDLPSGRWGGADHGFDGEGATRRNADLTSKLDRFVGVLGDSSSLNVAHIVKQMVKVAATRWGGEPLVDLLFIDGDHSFDGVVTDYALYSPLVKPGGVIAFHDVSRTYVHDRDGVEVARFWDAIPGHKELFVDKGAAWGGIGAVVRC